MEHDLQEGAAEYAAMVRKSIPGAQEQAVRLEGLGRCPPLPSASTVKQFRQRSAVRKVADWLDILKDGGDESRDRTRSGK